MVFFLYIFTNEFLQIYATLAKSTYSHAQIFLETRYRAQRSQNVKTFFYKNQRYMNKEAQNDPKFKNKLRKALASKSVDILRTPSVMCQ